MPPDRWKSKQRLRNIWGEIWIVSYDRCAVADIKKLVLLPALIALDEEPSSGNHNHAIARKKQQWFVTTAAIRLERSILEINELPCSDAQINLHSISARPAADGTSRPVGTTRPSRTRFLIRRMTC